MMQGMMSLLHQTTLVDSVQTSPSKNSIAHVAYHLFYHILYDCPRHARQAAALYTHWQWYFIPPHHYF
jgi:hypothetical protein